jgi:hypothetical protein
MPEDLTVTSSARTDVPSEICGYFIDSALSDSDTNPTYLAIGPGGRGVVLKKMEEDCLLRGQLHPSIRERLGRVRELAHGGVANLYGVGRQGEGDTAGAWLIWEFVDGQSFDDYAAAPGHTPRDLAMAGRELALAVDLLHMQGIVHGAIGGGNVIVTPTGSVRLTHVSPLLYSDPAVDVEAVTHLLQSRAAWRGESDTPLGRLLAAARGEKLALRPLAARLAALIESRDLDEPDPAEAQDAHRPRRWARYAAACVALLGVAAGLAAWRAGRSTAVREKVHEWLRK